MGRLVDFAQQLEVWRAVLQRAEARLCQVQEKYETFYAEIESARETELEQLREHLVAGRGSLPSGLDARLAEAWKEAEAQLETQLGELRARQATLAARAETVRRASVTKEAELHTRNVSLDEDEEALKVRNEALLGRIEVFQGRIRALGSGFGFFWNLFGLRRLQRERATLLEEQLDVRARIESLREAWQNADETWACTERNLREEWVEITTQAQAVQTKIRHIEQVRTRLIERSALEKVLYAREPELARAPEGAPTCARCGTPNHPQQAFCAICARRLKEDRPDLLGSLLEVAELNLHHRRFGEGVKACQEIIGLIRGLVSGLTNFRESVDGMIDTENRHPVGDLQIDVPAAARKYATNFSRLESACNVEKGLHPEAFAAQIGEAMEHTYGETQIQGFFETMGEELSRQADAQW